MNILYIKTNLLGFFLHDNEGAGLSLHRSRIVPRVLMYTCTSVYRWVSPDTPGFPINKTDRHYAIKLSTYVYYYYYFGF